MNELKFGSVCSGIEAASVAWHPLGWKAAWLAEIEPFPAAVLAHHYPDVPNLGDMTKIANQVLTGNVEAPDVLVGGTPCQAFSVAGLREGLADERGQLTIKYVELADAIDFIRGRRGQQPAIIVWENVPGVLSSKDNAFGCFLAALAGEDDEIRPPGEKWANAGCVFGPTRTVTWRVLDAQYFGVAQRRRRVFVVASARKDFYPTAVLFEFDGVRRDTAPSRKARQETAGTLASRTGAGGFPGTDEACSGYVQPVMCMAHGQGGAEIATERSPTLTCNHEAPIAFQPQCVTGDITHTLKAEGFDASEYGTGRGQPIVPVMAFQPGNLTRGAGSSPSTEVFPTLKADHGRGASDQDPHVAYSVALRGREGGATAELGDDLAGCLRASSGGGDKPHVLAFQSSQSGVRLGETHATLDANNGPRRHNGVLDGMAVRRLTPTECERLQGFPDGWTDVPYRGKPAADGPRYKALGNSMAVPCMAFIGRRINASLRAGTGSISQPTGAV